MVNQDKTKNAVAIFDKLADLYQGKFMDVTMYADSFHVFCDNLPENATVLELACGPGNITRYLLDYRKDLKILATDLSPNMIALGKINNPEVTFDMLDCRDILSLNQKYHGLMFGFCFPYLSKEDAIQLIADAAKMLHDNGVIYVSTMEDDYAKSGIEYGSTGDAIFMHYHEAQYLIKALKENGFDIILEQRKTYTSKDKDVVDLLIVAKIKL